MNKKAVDIKDIDLGRLKAKLEHGDIKKIADETGYSRDYVYKVLNPKDRRSNSEIVKEAVKIVRENHTVELPSELAESLVA